MTMNIKVSGTWQTVSPKIQVGGTWRDVLSGWVRVSGTWQQFFSAVSEFINTTGTSGTDATFVGYVLPAFGTITSSGTTDGKAIAGLYDAPGTSGFLSVSGFGADPGQTGWATNIIVDSVSRTFASASGYSYSAGEATWTWSGSPFGLVDTASYTLVIT